MASLTGLKDDDGSLPCDETCAKNGRKKIENEEKSSMDRNSCRKSPGTKDGFFRSMQQRLLSHPTPHRRVSDGLSGKRSASKLSLAGAFGVSGDIEEPRHGGVGLDQANPGNEAFVDEGIVLDSSVGGGMENVLGDSDVQSAPPASSFSVGGNAVPLLREEERYHGTRSLGGEIDGDAYGRQELDPPPPLSSPSTPRRRGCGGKEPAVYSAAELVSPAEKSNEHPAPTSASRRRFLCQTELDRKLKRSFEKLPRKDACSDGPNSIPDALPWRGIVASHTEKALSTVLKAQEGSRRREASFGSEEFYYIETNEKHENGGVESEVDDSDRSLSTISASSLKWSLARKRNDDAEGQQMRRDPTPVSSSNPKNVGRWKKLTNNDQLNEEGKWRRSFVGLILISTSLAVAGLSVGVVTFVLRSESSVDDVSSESGGSEGSDSFGGGGEICDLAPLPGMRTGLYQQLRHKISKATCFPGVKPLLAPDEVFDNPCSPRAWALSWFVTLLRASMLNTTVMLEYTHDIDDPAVNKSVGVPNGMDSKQLLLPTTEADNRTKEEFGNNCSVLQRYVLALIYRTMGGSRWVSNSGWVGPHPECTWEGVTCNRRHIVTSIDLSNNFVRGKLPLEINALSLLEMLNFRRNSIAGTIPSSIGKMKNLVLIDLSWNDLTGQIPDGLYNLTQLVTLNLMENKLKGTIPQSSTLCARAVNESLARVTVCSIDNVECGCCIECMSR